MLFFKKHPLLMPHNQRHQGYSFLCRAAGLLVLVLLCISCTSPSLESSSREEALSGSGAGGQEKETAVDDAACAYFYFLWGKTAENNQRLEEAMEAYEKALLCDEGSEYIKRSLAILFIKMDRKEQAVNELQQIISRNPRDTEDRVLLAKVYSSMGRNDEAIAVYQELLEIDEDHDTLLMLGTLYAQNREYDKAQKVLNRLIELEADSYLGYYYLARLYRELQYVDKAAAAYDKALELNWFDRLAYEVAEFYESHQYEKAVAVYRRIIAEGESTDLAKTRLVNLYLTLGENDKALELLRDLRTLLPDSYNVDITMSRILLGEEKYDEAIMLLEDVLQVKPELTAVRYLLAMAYYRTHAYQKAEEQLQFIPVESNLYEDSIFLQVRILGDSDNDQAAMDLLQKQISDPATRKPGFYILLASLYRENQEVEHGRDVYEEALRLYPDDIDLLYNYGIFLEKIGEQENAMTRMQALLALDPENGAALNYVGYTWADNGVHLEKALEYIKKAVGLMPEDGYVRDSLGWVYYKMGNVQQAIIELEKASEMVGSDPVVQEHLGDVYTETEQFDKALAAYEAAYQLFTEKEKKERVSAKINGLKIRSTK
jgi:tetratricopeptide (TPR) repeat protein